MKPKLICILHCSPPNHGASKVGDFIFSCEALRENFNSRFIKINSSSTISQIDKIQFKKFTSTFILYVKILSSLLIHRPDKVYFTASNKSYAFYRDFLIGFFFKIYNFLRLLIFIIIIIQRELMILYLNPDLKNGLQIFLSRMSILFFLAQC